MKKILLGMLIMLTASIVNHEIWLRTENKKDDGAETRLHKVSVFLEYKVFQGGYIMDPVRGNCRDEQAENGFGWKFNVADYYDCDAFQRMLDGNFKKSNPDSPKY
jgi:hypothetical protein